MNQKEMTRCEQIFQATKEYLTSLGLVVPEVSFEVASTQKVIAGAVYGFPINVPHTSYGSDMEYFNRASSATGGNFFAKEIVFNDPKRPKAFLLESNPFLLNVLVIVHVCGHVDFFRKNIYFSDINFVDLARRAANARQRFLDYCQKYGEDTVMSIITSAMTIAKHHFSDTGSNSLNLSRVVTEENELLNSVRVRLNEISYSLRHDLFLSRYDKEELGKEKKELIQILAKMKQDGIKDPLSPQYDLIDYLLINSPLARHGFVRDILETIRMQGRYFAVLQRTRMLNEGWASYWHYEALENLVNRGLISMAELLKLRADYDTNTTANVKIKSGEFNDYAVGSEFYRYTRARYDRIGGPGAGLAKILEIRERYADGGAIGNFFTDEFIAKMELFEWEDFVDSNDRKYRVVTNTNPKLLRQKFASDLALRGIPTLTIEDGNYNGRGELLIRHRYTGFELNPKQEELALASVYRLWQNIVWLQTFRIVKPESVDNPPELEPVFIKFDGTKAKEEKVNQG